MSIILFAMWIYDNVKDSLDIPVAKVLFSSYLKKTLIIREQKNHTEVLAYIFSL